MRAAHPSDVAMINGGGMRAALPAGPLTYGRLYETFPFDNAFASLRLPAGEFRRLLARSLGRAGSLVSLSGLRVQARCEKGAVEATLTRPDGSEVRDEEVLAVTTTDFLATGGDGFFAGAKIDYEIGRPFATPWPRPYVSAAALSIAMIVRCSIQRTRASPCPPKFLSTADPSRSPPHCPSGLPGSAGAILASSTPMAWRMVGVMSRCSPAPTTDASLVPRKMRGAFPWFLVPTSNP